MHYTFEAEQWLPHPLATVFLFFADPRNLPRLMPGWQKARIEEASFAPPPPAPEGTTVPPRAVIAGAGTRLTISFRPFPFAPIRIPWEAEIAEFTWNEHFCDVQHRGPFSSWRHCHRLFPAARVIDGRETAGTLLHDHVSYAPPGGRLGELASPLLRAQLASTFRFRHRRTAKLLARR